MSADSEKELAAQAAVPFVKDGMRVGLGTGSTVAFFLTALARARADVTCVATSTRTEEMARSLGLRVEPFDTLDRLDLAVDGADQISPEWWLIKGAGGAQTREKIVAAAAERFIVIADSSKIVAELHAPVPLELHRFGLQATLRSLGNVTMRDVAPSPDDGVIADFHGAVGDPSALSQLLAATPGVVGHGLFAPTLVATVLVGVGTTVEELRRGERR